MGVLMIRCPATGREISTGIEADPQTFKATPVFFARTFCPICRRQHDWFAQQAWVSEPTQPRLRRDRGTINVSQLRRASLHDL